MITDAQQALAQVREALAAGPTPGPWSLKTVPTSDGSCHKIGPFPTASRVHSETHACVYAIGIRLGIDDSRPVARELLANARLMAACSPANVATILAHVEAKDGEIERMTEENRRLRADLLAGRNVVNAGLTIHTLTIERDMLRQEIERLTADRSRLLNAARRAVTALAAAAERTPEFQRDYEMLAGSLAPFRGEWPKEQR